MENMSFSYPADKKGMYSLLTRQLSSLLEGERDLISGLANASALIFGALEDINWAGFYLARGDELVLGPFQGRPACVRIPFGRGVCGAAAEQAFPQLVPDVHLFPGHIACDSASRSEIVVPIMTGGRVCGVLDIDSPLPSRFDEEDLRGLSALCGILEDCCDWQ